MVKDDDIIELDAVNHKMTLKIDNDEIQERKRSWKQPLLKATKGVLFKYAACVTNAAEGCVTDEAQRSYETKLQRAF